MHQCKNQSRRGSAAVLLCVLMVPLLFLLAFSVDYGFLLFVESSLQRAADQAALAGARELVPDSEGNQDFDRTREVVRQYVRMNLGDDFVVLDEDIEIGRYNPNTVYSSVELLDNGIQDTVRVTIRQDSNANRSISLYFAKLFGNNETAVSVSSAAALQKAAFIGPGADVFPFALQRQAWNRLDFGEAANIYGDGKITDENGRNIPGNWGTLDIGSQSNSTSELANQIVNGLTQQDLNDLYAQGAISTPDYIDPNINTELNGDTGLSAGLKHSLADVEGQTRIAPIYKKTTGKGGNLLYEVTGWVSVKVIDSRFRGSKNSYVSVEKSYAYDEKLLPIADLSETTDVIEGAFTAPKLLE